jgi:hypothetical protein
MSRPWREWLFAVLHRPPSVATRMTAVREAFRCRRQAGLYHRLWRIHCDSKQPELARDVRALVLEQLRAACLGWRTALGLGPVEPRTAMPARLGSTGAATP